MIMKNVFKAGNYPDFNGKHKEDLDATQQLDFSNGVSGWQDSETNDGMTGSALDEAGFFDPFADEESAALSEHESRTAYELGYEDETEFTQQDVFEEKPVVRTRTKHKQTFGAKFKRWIQASTGNKVILIAGAVVLVAVLALIIWLIASGGASDDPLAGKVDENEVQNAIEDNYSFVDESEYAGTLLTKTEDAGEEYLKETLFIGDSNFARIVMYGFLDYDNVIGVESMGIQGVTGSKSVYFEGYSEPVTITKAVSMMKPRRIIICFGTNNLLTNDAEAFAEDYKDALDALHEAYSYSDIIICAIPPLGENRSNKALKQETMDEYNHALIDLARDEGYTYLDTSEVLKGSNGYIKPDYIYSDGIHLTEKGFDMFFKYVRTHAHIVEDTRPKPIGDIPKQVAPPKQEVEEGAEFDPNLVASEAVKQFVAAGCKSGTGTTTATTWSFTIPYDAEAGTEINWANSLYTAYLAQKGTPVAGSYVVISSTKNSAEFVFTVTMYPVPTCETHTWEDTGKVTEATCGKAGTKEQKCKVCGAVQTIEDPNKPATGKHTWSAAGEGWVTDAGQASCAETINQTRKCKVCGKTETQTAKNPSATAHDWGSGWTTDPGQASCAESVTQTRTCKNCGKKETQTDANPSPTSHDWGSGWVTDAGQASCAAEVTQTRTCKLCGRTETQKIPNPSQGAHTWGEWVDIGNGKEQQTCSGCGATQQRDKPVTESEGGGNPPPDEGAQTP